MGLRMDGEDREWVGDWRTKKKKGAKRVYFMSTTICEDRLSSHAMNVGLIEDEGRRIEDRGEMEVVRRRWSLIVMSSTRKGCSLPQSGNQHMPTGASKVLTAMVFS
jgi:hypothetical protein